MSFLRNLSLRESGEQESKFLAPCTAGGSLTPSNAAIHRGACLAPQPRRALGGHSNQIRKHQGAEYFFESYVCHFERSRRIYLGVN
jgi:hypothetical protein